MQEDSIQHNSSDDSENQSTVTIAAEIDQNTQTASSQPAPKLQERSQLDKFLDSLISNSIIKEIYLSPLGAFIPESFFRNFLGLFQNWLKIETGAEGILAEERCLKIIFQDSTNSTYYILDGKNCKVGFLIKAKPLEQFKNKFKLYAGTPIDGRKSIHQKDPALNSLPDGVSINFSSQGHKLQIRTGNLKFIFDLNDLPQIIHLFKGSPRLRRFRSKFQLAIRDLIPEFSKLIAAGQEVKKERLKIIPARFRKQSQISYLRLSDTYLLFDYNHEYIGSFGLKGKNLFDFISFELRTLQHSVRSRRINVFDLDTRSKHLAGNLRLQNERFYLPVNSLLEWIQLYKMPPGNIKNSSPASLYDFIVELTKDFISSGWQIDRDIPNRYKNFSNRKMKGKIHLNYRTSGNYLYAIDKKFEIVSIMRWIKPKIREVQIKNTIPINS